MHDYGRKEFDMLDNIKLAMIVNGLNINGISTVIMNYCERLDPEKFDVDILAGRTIDSSYIERCREKCIRIIELPSRKESPIQYYTAIWKILKNNYDIVHVHGNSATITVELLIAWLRGVKVRIAHSHNSACEYMNMHKLLLPLFRKAYTYGFACSSLAGEWLFGNSKFYVLPNGFDTKKFIFKNENRKEMRRSLGVEGKFVIGHIGRFNNQKNQSFLLDVFNKVVEMKTSASLLLIGNGPDYEKIKNMIARHPYKDKIILYGEISDVQKLYAAMDVFVFPSKHEGLGIVLLEAQISGLPCISSDVVPKDDVKLSENIKFLSLDDGKDVWAKEIVASKGTNRETFYEIHRKEILKYDIADNTKNLEKLYIEFLGRTMGAGGETI